MANVTITPEQRDALLFAIKDERAVARDLAQDEAAPRQHDRYVAQWAPTMAALEDDLADDGCEIRSVPRQALVDFLQHRAKEMLGAGLSGDYLCLWHTAVTLLDVLGHREIDGSIYVGMSCHCPECKRRVALWASLEVAAEAAASDEELAELGREYRRALDGVA